MILLVGSYGTRIVAKAAIISPTAVAILGHELATVGALSATILAFSTAFLAFAFLAAF